MNKVKYKALLLPAIQATIIISIPLFDSNYHFYWYQYLFAYLGWVGVFGLIYKFI